MKSEPCFHFYGGSTLVHVIRGSNGPVIAKYIKEGLEKEHACRSGEAERVAFVDSAVAAAPAAVAVTEEAAAPAAPQEPPKEHTLGILKEGSTEERDAVFAKLAEAGFKVPAQCTLSFEGEGAEEALAKLKQLYPALSEEEAAAAATGEWAVLVLSKPDVVAEWPAFVAALGEEGEEAAEEEEGEAKAEGEEEAPAEPAEPAEPKPLPEGFHASASADDAKREIAIFFEGFAAADEGGEPAAEGAAEGGEEPAAEGGGDEAAEGGAAEGEAAEAKPEGEAAEAKPEGEAAEDKSAAAEGEEATAAEGGGEGDAPPAAEAAPAEEPAAAE